jgi:hypothetical protein
MTCYLEQVGKYIGNWRNIVENSMGILWEHIGNKNKYKGKIQA